MNAYLLKIQDKLGKFYVPSLLLIMSLVLYLVGFSQVKPKEYQFELNQVAEQTIQSPITIEDTEQTQINQQRARDSVADVYAFQEDILDQQIKHVIDLFNGMAELKTQTYNNESLKKMAQGIDLRAQVLLQENLSQREDEESVPYSKLNDYEQIIVIRFYLKNADQPMANLNQVLSNEAIIALNDLSDEDLTTLRNHLIEILTVTLNQDFQANELNDYLDEAYQIVEDLNFDLQVQEILKQFLSVFIIPTSVVSPKETAKRKEEAAEAVPPSYILQGQIIIQEGHIVNQNTMRQLDLLGLLSRESSQDAIFIFMILIIIHVAVIVSLIHQSDLDKIEKNKVVTAYTIMFTLSFLALNFLNYLQEQGLEYALLLYPVLFILMIMIDKMPNPILNLFAVALNIFSLFVIYNGNNLSHVLMVMAYYIFSGIFAKAYHTIYGNSKSLKKVLFYGIIGNVFFSMVMIAIMSLPIFSDNTLLILALTMASLLISLVLYFFIEPYWSALLSSKAELTLQKLSNLNHPLLTRLIETAPGSYHHSVMVASLASSAAEAIGADSLLARVASYYHDVGKILHPLFFIENLSGGMESPHGFVTAEESAQIIIGHVEEGEKLLKSFGMPQSIIDICLQHHGTTQVKYFYNQAKLEADHPVDPENFTYPGPKPQSKEAMVIMIADSVEAACRTLKSYSQDSIENLIENIVAGKINEQQFTDNDLSVSELEIVKKSLVKSIASMYHTRIEYPD